MLQSALQLYTNQEPDELVRFKRHLRTLLVALAERLANAARALDSDDAAVARPSAFARALADDHLVLHYQPKMHARSGEIEGVEALIRWAHPERGLLAPDEFVPGCEINGDIRALTEWAMARAVRDQQSLARRGYDLPLYVNISAKLIGDPAFTERLLEIAAPRIARIGVEITETAMIEDPERGLENLRRMADAGLRIAIDDYGVGLSSLNYLKQLPAHELKIDRAFVSGLSRSHRDPLLVRSTIDLAHALGLQVTAEGVETPAALALLKVMGCDIVQGYLIARPMPLDDLIIWLANRAPIEPGLPAFPALPGSAPTGTGQTW